MANTPPPLPLRYQHRVVTVGDDWYIEVQVLSRASTTNSTDLLPVISVKHGWPLERIVITGVKPAPIVAVGVGAKLRKIHEEAQQNTFRNDIKVVVPWCPGELLGNEPLTRY